MGFLQWFVVAVLTAAFIAFVVETLIPRIIVLLGNVDSWWSPFRTLPPPGEMYILVRGDPDGPFDSILESVIDYNYDTAMRRFEPVTPGTTLPPNTSFLHDIGITYVGLWKYFLWREVKYAKWEKKPDPSTEWGLVSKTRGVKGKSGDSPSIFFQYNMATKIEAAETADNFPVDGVMVFTVQMVDPVQALFFAGGWESQVNAAVQGVFREHVSTRPINVLREEKAGGADNLVSKVKALSETSVDTPGLRQLYGVNIIDARFVEFDLVTGDEEMTRAVRAVGIAREQAEARREKAKGEKDGAIIEAEGKREALKIEAEGIKEEYAARASQTDGAKFALAEAIKVAKPTVIGGDVLATINAERRP